MPSPPDPVAVEVFGVAVRWYALFILTGVVAALVLVRWLARRRGLDADFPLDIAPSVVLIGIAGARLAYVLVRGDLLADPLQAINLRLGGLSIHGALAAGALTVVWWCRRRRQPLLTWADVLVPGVALGQAIGRWGNWANQEAFGRPTDLPWGLAIAPDHRPAAFAGAATFHPTFLYESLFNLANAGLLSWTALNVPRRPWLRPGDGLWLYCVTYGLGRLLIEPLRLDSLYIGPLPGPVWASLALIGFGLAMLVGSRVRTNRGQPEPAAAD